MSRARSFVHEWIDLVERSGLLVSEPVLHRFFPGGPEHVEPRQQRALLSAWERFQVDPSDGQRQSAWLDAVLFGLLEWPEDRLARGPRLPPSAALHLPELDQSLRPSAVLTGEGDRFLLGVWRIAADQKPDRVERIEGTWRATPAAKLERWLRESGTPFGLLTGGPAFRLVHVPPGLPASWIEFPASTFFEEKSVLDGFWSLLRVPRFFGAAEGRLEHFAAESQKAQADLTESLGEQVRKAVEELILALDRADRGSGQHPLDIGTGGRIFLGHDPDEIYKAAVYIVMRLVFILFAEERSLLPHGNVFFDEGYGLGRLLHLLEEEKRTRPERFDREEDAWPRLLGLFRLIFLGSPHPDLPLPAYGGDLFSPTDFPALAALESEILRIPNRSVYAILRALTFGEAKVGKEKIAQRYSYRNLDVEHIGYLYEGLLDHHAARAGREPMVKLANGTEVAIRLSELEALGPHPLPDPPPQSGRGRPLPEVEKLVSFLAERGVAGGDRGRIESWLMEPSAGAVAEIDRLPEEIARRCRPYAGVIQTDEVVLPGRLYLTTSSSRRATGTHYTPIQYTRAMVAETLEPLVYVGEHGKLEEPRRLRSPRELLDLKVCDPAMGSGAFLVQVIRYLGEKLADSWQAERERRGEGVALYLPYAEPGAAREDRIPLPDERTDAELWARRLVAERCVYGVDKNPLAVEMAKLSIWLVTLDPQKPFSFVNHALMPGDSLLGISSLGQLQRFSLSGEGEQLGLLEERIAQGVRRASQLRQQIGNLAVVNPADVVQKERLLTEADREVRSLRALADLLVATITRSKKPAEQEAARIELLARISYLLDSREELDDLVRREIGDQQPLHWPLAFPEVFERKNGGFDAFVGNPPYMGGQKLTGSFGEPYREYLVRHIAEGARGSADLVAYFFLRSFGLLRAGGGFGLLAVNTIAEGDTRQVGLEQLLQRGGAVYSAHPNEPWPNQAAVVTSRVHVHRGQWEGAHFLLGRPAPTISAFLTDREEWSPKPLKANEGIAFQGSIVLGMGFVLSEAEALALLDRDPRNADVLFPYLNGEDLNSHPEQRPSRWVINFWDWPEEKAKEYPEPFAIVEERVKPQRMKVKRATRRTRWWQFAELASGLYHAIGRGQMFQKHPEGWSPAPTPAVVLVSARVSRHFSPISVPNSYVFNEKTVVFRAHSVMNQGFLCSSIAGAWVWARSSRLKFDLNFSPADALETLPLYEGKSELVDEAGKVYEDLRRGLMTKHKIGLTELNNHLHRSTNSDAGIIRLREALMALDSAVASAYRWSDLELGHDFHPVPFLAEGDRVRFTIAEKIRREILDRLAQLNRARHEEELAQDFDGTKKTTKQIKRSLRQPGVLDFPKPAQPTLFPVSPQMEFWEVAEPTASPASERSYLTDSPAATYGKSHEIASNGLSIPAQALLAWLRQQTDWRSRSDALENTGFTPADWPPAIQELLAAGLVERTGEKRGTRYRAKL